MTDGSKQRGAPAPGSVIGIMGGGQLGRMTAIAAARLGYRCHIFTPERDGPASQVSYATTIADYGDKRALARFADAVDVVTFEFENIPHASLTLLEARVPVRPSVRALEISQDRLIEKDFLRSIGVPVADYRAVHNAAELAEAYEAFGRDAILKTSRFGYDGKGQVRMSAKTKPQDAWRKLGAKIAILEKRIDFACEVSVVIARGLDGKSVHFVPVENRHRHGILDTTMAPALILPAVARQAVAMARRTARALDLVGVLAVEMFVTRQGKVLANEIAPRPHNSGHWTIDACQSSQFEQHVRAVCGLPLGSPERHHDALMKNLIGRDVLRWKSLVRDRDAKLHLYGKHEARAGRKMGHVTWLRPKSA
ncbi:MAG: 5-(carboxyamino)imidazole ribonucleotide synthase [Alphaproteobacteria bacterium]